MAMFTGTIKIVATLKKSVSDSLLIKSLIAHISRMGYLTPQYVYTPTGVDAHVVTKNGTYYYNGNSLNEINISQLYNLAQIVRTHNVIGPTTVNPGGFAILELDKENRKLSCKLDVKNYIVDGSLVDLGDKLVFVLADADPNNFIITCDHAHVIVKSK